MLITCTLLVCIDARAQNACEGLTENVRLLYRDLNTGSDDELVTLAITASRGRKCYGEQSHARRIWLIQKEVYALDLLHRYDEARAVIDLFFNDSTLVGEAVSKDKGRMYMWRLLLFLYEGDYEGAAGAYRDALHYADALLPAQQAGLLLPRSHLLGIDKQPGVWSRLAHQSPLGGGGRRGRLHLCRRRRRCHLRRHCHCLHRHVKSIRNPSWCGTRIY